VFLLDDHELLRHGVRSLLENEPDMTVIGEAATVAEAKSRIPELNADVAILDIRLPDGNGIEVCQFAQTSINPPPACLILTSYADNNALYRAIYAGAAGYLLKGEPATELIKVVRTVASGVKLLDHDVVTIRFAESSDPIAAAGLTTREEHVLELLTKGMTSREIAAMLVIATSTIEKHVHFILLKLGVRSRTEAAVLAATRRTKRTLM
jgi:DNA-binding NarL/FixJ family response regulator